MNLTALAVITVALSFVAVGAHDLHIATDQPPAAQFSNELLYGSPSILGHQAVVPSTPVKIQTDFQQLDVIPDGAGNFITAFIENRPPVINSMITLQKFAPDGTLLWGANGVTLGSHFVHDAQLVADGAGGALFFWDDGAAAYVQGVKSDQSLAFGAPVVLANSAPCNTGTGHPNSWRFNQQVKSAVSDGAGGMIAVWDDGNGDQCAQRIDNSGSLLWGDGATVLSMAGVTNVIADGAGGAIIALASNDANILHLDGGGATVAGCPAQISATDDLLAAVSDNAGGAVIVDNPVSPTMFHVESDCTLDPAWPALGVPIASSYTYRSMSVAVIGSQAIAAWRTSGGAEDVRANAVGMSNGSLAWGGEQTVANGYSAGDDYADTVFIAASGPNILFTSIKSSDNATPNGGAVIMALDAGSGAAAPGFGAGLDILNAPDVPLASVADGSGGLDVVYYDSTTDDSGSYLTYVARFDGSGASLLPAPAPLAGTAIEYAHDITLPLGAQSILNDDGSKAVIWTEDTNYPGGEASHVSTLKMRVFNSDGTPRTPATVVDSAAGDNTVKSEYLDAAYGWGTVWILFRHIDAGGSYISLQRYGDNTPLLSGNGIHISTDASAMPARILIGTNGDLFISYFNSGFRLTHYTPWSGFDWNGGSGVQIGTACDSRPFLVNDGNGGIFATWSAAGRVHATHLEGSGNVQSGWGGADGASVQMADNAVPSGAATDGAGEFLVAYLDADQHAIYAQKLDSSGAPLWGVEGEAVADGADAQTFDPDDQFDAAASDAFGGMIISWLDSAGGNPTIRAQRLDGSGNRMWGAPTANPGLRVNDTNDTVGANYDLVNDGVGGAIFAYYDEGATDSLKLAYVDAAGGVMYGGPTTVAGNTAVIGRAGLARIKRALFVTWLAEPTGASTGYIYGEGYQLPTSTAATPLTALDQDPKLALMPSGEKAMVWSTRDYYSNDRSLYHADVHLKIFSPSGALIDSTVVNEAVGDETVVARYADVAADAAGFYVSYGHQDEGGGYLAVQKFDPTGTALWGAGVQIAGNAGLDQSRLAPDGTGGIFTTYLGDGFRALHIASSGAFAWGPTGVRIGDDSNLRPFLLSDGAGGVAIAWAQSQRISLTHLDGAGATTAGFAAGEGIQISGFNEAIEPALIYNPDGTLLLQYTSLDYSGPTILVNKVSLQGVLLWSGVSRMVATNVNCCGTVGSDPKIVSDGAGGMVIVWENNDGNLFAQRVDGSGALLWGTALDAHLTEDKSWTQGAGDFASIDTVAGIVQNEWTACKIEGIQGGCSYYVSGGDPFVNAAFYSSISAVAGTTVTQITGLSLNGSGGNVNGFSLTPDTGGGAAVSYNDLSGSPEVALVRVGGDGKILPQFPQIVSSNVGGDTSVVGSGDNIFVSWSPSGSNEADIQQFINPPSGVVANGNSGGGGVPVVPDLSSRPIIADVLPFSIIAVSKNGKTDLTLAGNVPDLSQGAAAVKFIVMGGAAGGENSDWIKTLTWSAGGLNVGQTYAVQLQTRDVDGNAGSPLIFKVTPTSGIRPFVGLTKRAQIVLETESAPAPAGQHATAAETAVKTATTPVIRYTITAANTGSANAYGIVISDVIPKELKYDEGGDEAVLERSGRVAANDGWGTVAYDPAAATLGLTIPLLEPGAAETLTFDALPVKSVTSTVKNKATAVYSDTP